MSTPNYPDDCPSPDFDPESIYDNPPDYVSLRDAYLELRTNVSRDTARLNSGTILLTVHGERVHFVAQDLRAAIDAGIAANAEVRDGGLPPFSGPSVLTPFPPPKKSPIMRK